MRPEPGRLKSAGNAARRRRSLKLASAIVKRPTARRIRSGRDRHSERELSHTHRPDSASPSFASPLPPSETRQSTSARRSVIRFRTCAHRGGRRLRRGSLRRYLLPPPADHSLDACPRPTAFVRRPSPAAARPLTTVSPPAAAVPPPHPAPRPSDGRRCAPSCSDVDQRPDAARFQVRHHGGPTDGRPHGPDGRRVAAGGLHLVEHGGRALPLRRRHHARARRVAVVHGQRVRRPVHGASMVVAVPPHPRVRPPTHARTHSRSAARAVQPARRCTYARGAGRAPRPASPTRRRSRRRGRAAGRPRLP